MAYHPRLWTSGPRFESGWGYSFGSFFVGFERVRSVAPPDRVLRTRSIRVGLFFWFFFVGFEYGFLVVSLQKLYIPFLAAWGMAKKSTTSENSKICAILSYVLVGIIWYFVDDTMRSNSFVKFHVKQALVLLIVSVLFMFVSAILIFIPILGWLVIFVGNLALIALWIFGLYHSATDKETELPVIGQFAEKLTF